MRRRKEATAHEADEHARQSGFVAVWMAIVLFVLIGVAAFAVDLVHAYLVGQQVQNAADAAATAGSAQIPNDIPCGAGGHARSTAVSLARTNLTGDNLAVDPNDIDAHCSGPNEMTVEIKAKIDTWFARALGFSTLTVHREAVAQFDPALAMGSPANNLGDVPGDSCTDLGFGLGGTPCASVPLNATQNLFAQIEGPETDKLGGNAYSAGFCNDGPPPVSAVIPDGCSATGAGGNDEFDTTTGGDETFYVQNDNPGQQLLIAVYDAGFVDTGGFCAAGTNAITGGLTYPLRYGDTPAQAPYCAGDRRQAGVDPNGTNAMDTEFQVLDPDGNPVPGCDTGPIAGQEPPNGAPLLAEGRWFQQWQPICTIATTDPTRNTYRVRVHSAGGQGTNNFSLLALHGLGSSPPLNLAIASHQRLPLFASKPDGTAGSFYLARVPGSSEARTLTLDFFDLGDSVQPPGPTCTGGVPKPAGGCPSTGTIAIHSDGDPTPFTNCTITTPVGGNQSNGLNTGPPWGTQGSPQSCSFSYDRATWNGQWVTVQVQIPVSPGYGCSNFNDFQQCWIKIDITPNVGSAPLSDATTWNARINGAPVRLTG
jgi:Putative Flp pilus-assembly TadE/G-like